MTELLLPIIIFAAWTLFSFIFIIKYKHHQTTNTANKKSYWNNNYIFEIIPPVFPTLGILCTAIGITIGIWSFDAKDIQNSIPQLLGGLKFAFIATILGILGLIIFQKWTAIIQKQIDDTPNKPIIETNELSAISALTFEVQELKNDNQKQIEKLIQSFGNDLENKVSLKLSNIEKATLETQNSNKELVIQLKELRKEQKETARQANSETIKLKGELIEKLIEFKQEQKETATKANKNTDEIIKAMSENNKLTSKKFDEFSELLRKNNTEALVEIMKLATEQFNEQMSELINKLVQENFAELNNSVKSLNDWQYHNKEQVQKLTEQFQNTSEMFTISATTLKQVAENTKSLTDDDSKLSQLISELKRVMIEDSKFQEITNKLTNTIQILANTTESFDKTTSKLNDWVITEKNFKDAAVILISKLEEFRDFNGDVWQNYRNEMNNGVAVISKASKSISSDLDNINAEFINSLNTTLQNLDTLIQRFISGNNKPIASSIGQKSKPNVIPRLDKDVDDLPF